MFLDKEEYKCGMWVCCIDWYDDLPKWGEITFACNGAYFVDDGDKFATFITQDEIL